MRRRLSGRVRAAVVCAVAVVGVLGLAGCSDDGAGVRSEGKPTSTGASGTSGGSGSGSGSGLGEADLGTQSPDKVLQAAAASYKQFVLGEAGTLRVETKRFTDAVRSGNLDQAKQLYAPSRQSWERIEPVAGLVRELDGKLDARVDDFAGPDDPKFSGWHRLEYLLWVNGTTEGGRSFADQLDTDLGTLEERLRTIEITPKAVALGAGELVEEVSKEKISGEEDRYSHTDLWDMAANISGAEAAVRVFLPALTTKAPILLATIQQHFAAVNRSLLAYRMPSGAYKPYTALRAADKSRLQVELAALSAELAKLPAALGVG
jgi:iron uptake system component EfeO